MPESPFSPSNQCFGINKIDRSNVFNCPSSSASLSTAKVFTATTNIITKPSLSIPGRDSIKQSVKTRTSLVGGKFKIKQWKITKANGAIFSDTNRSFKIRLASLLQQDVSWGKWSEKEENLHINFLELIAAKFAIPTFTKEQSNIAIHLQIDNKTALSYLLKKKKKGGWGVVHTTNNSCTSASLFGVTLSANKMQCLWSTFPVL